MLQLRFARLRCAPLYRRITLCNATATSSALDFSDGLPITNRPRQHRALMEAVETRIFAVANSGQTASNPNTINTADHRWVGHGTSQSIVIADFAKADYALRKANVPMTNLVAVVDPSVAYTLPTQANMVN